MDRFNDRVDEFDDNVSKSRVLSYFRDWYNCDGSNVVISRSFPRDDRGFCSGEMSIFDGYFVEKNSDDSFRRVALVEVKERFKDYEWPLIEYSKIYKWLEHRAKWSQFYYLNLLPSGLWVLPIHELGLERWSKDLSKVSMSGVKQHPFNRITGRLGGVVLKTDSNKNSLIIDRNEHWFFLNNFRRNDNDE